MFLTPLLNQPIEQNHTLSGSPILVDIVTLPRPSSVFSEGPPYSVTNKLDLNKLGV